VPGDAQAMPTRFTTSARIGYLPEPASEPRRSGIGRGSVRAVRAAGFPDIASWSSPDRRAAEEQRRLRSVVAGSGGSL
jgi:hypothetical protein